MHLYVGYISTIDEKIVWANRNRLQNIAKHGMDFAELDARVFASSKIILTKRGRSKTLSESLSESNHHRRGFQAPSAWKLISVISMPTSHARRHGKKLAMNT